MVVTRFKRGTTFLPSWFRPRQLSCGVRSRLNWGQRPSFVHEEALRCRVKFKLSRVGLTPPRRPMRGGQAVLITNARSVASSCSTSPLAFPDSPVSLCIKSGFRFALTLCISYAFSSAISQSLEQPTHCGYGTIFVFAAPLTFYACRLL